MIKHTVSVIVWDSLTNENYAKKVSFLSDNTRSNIPDSTYYRRISNAVDNSDYLTQHAAVLKTYKLIDGSHLIITRLDDLVTTINVVSASEEEYKSGDDK